MTLPFLKNKTAFYKKNFKILIYFFWFISVVYLFYNIKKNFNQFGNEVIIDFKQFFFYFVLVLVLKNIINYRFFFALKKLTKYSDNYSEWSYLFFKTAIMNYFIWGSGHLSRAIMLKEKNINYKKFISVNFFLFLLVFFFNIVFYFILSYFFIKDKTILLHLFIFILLLFFLLKKEFYFFILRFIQTKFIFLKNNFKFIYKFFFFYSNFIFLSKKNLLVIFYLSLLIFFLEFFIYYTISINIFSIEKFSFEIILIFFLILNLQNLPILSNYIGVNELFAGLFAESLGFNFFYGFVIQLTFRSMSYICCLVWNLFYYLMSFKKKVL
jgi:hypothetical protein